MKRAAKKSALSGLAASRTRAITDLVEAVKTYERLQRDAKILSDQLRTIGDGGMHGRLRVVLSTIERIRGYVRALLGES